MPQPYLIAEAGTNHNGCLEDALKLIEIAVHAGADSVKFQMINPDGLYVPERWEGTGIVPNEVYLNRKRFTMAYEDYREAKRVCAERQIDFSASVFDEEGLDFLASLRPPYIKIASCDLNHLEFLKKAARKKIRLILSTGMSTLDEIRRAVKVIEKEGNRDLILMHCVSVYPAPLKIMNLGFIDRLKKNFPYPIGLSDHTQGSLAAAMAAAKGTAVIEKHFTYDRKAQGFDHANSLGPEEFTQFVRDVREAAQASAGEERVLTPEELEVMKRARRSIYAARDIPPGKRIDAGDVLIVRPMSHIPSDEVGRVLGSKSVRLIKRYEPLRWEDLAERP